MGLGAARCTADQRNLAFLKDDRPEDLEGVRWAPGSHAQELFPALRDPRLPNLPEELMFLHAEEILEMYPGPSPEAA